MSDQERDRLSKTEDEDGAEDVEAHRLAKDAGQPADEDATDDVEAHRLS